MIGSLDFSDFSTARKVRIISRSSPVFMGPRMAALFHEDAQLRVAGIGEGFSSEF